MQDAALARADLELRFVESMVERAHALGLRFGAAAEAEADHRRCLDLFDAFNRSFLAVRMGIRLSLALRASAKPARAAATARLETETETEAPETEALETERPERDPIEGPERERDRDQEPVSLPRFLATLRGVAADATRLGLPADARAEAASLHDLLGRAGAATAPAVRPAGGLDLLVRPPPQVAPKARAALLGSAAAPRPRELSGLSRPPPYPSG